MGNSTLSNICSSWNFNPLNLCTYGIVASCFYFIATILFVLGFLIRKIIVSHFGYRRLDEVPRPQQSKREGPLTKSFLIVLIIITALIFLPWIYYFAHITDLKNSTAFYIWASCHTSLWIVALCLPFRDTHRVAPCPSQILIFVSPVLMSVPVVTFWDHFFDSNPLTTPYFLYAVVEVSLSSICLLLTVSHATLRDVNNREGKWVKIESAIFIVAQYIWPKKEFLLQLRIYVCVFLLVIGRITNIIYPLYTKWIIDDLSRGVFCYKLIIIASGIKFLQGSAMGGFLNTLRSQLWIPISQYTTMQVQTDMFLHLHQLSLRWHLSRKTGEIIRIMDRGTKSIQTLLMYIVFSVAPTIIDIIIATTVFFVAYNYYFGGLVFTTMVLYLTCTIFITEWRTHHRRDMNKAENEWQFIGVDSLLNCETVKQFCAEMKEYNRYKSAVGDFQKAEYKNSSSLNMLNSLQNLIIGLSMSIGCVLIGFFITQPNSTFTSGDYVMFTTYLLQLFGPLNFFGTLYRTIQNAFVDMENMFEFLDEKLEILEAENPEPMPTMPFTINFDDVCFAYNPEQPVLTGVTFSANAGETIGIVGATGSGKSTLVRLLFRLYDVTGGSIKINNIDIRRFAVHDLRSNIGIVPQDVVLFNATVAYNIGYGKLNPTREEIENVAKQAQIHDFIMSLPNQYDTLVGERGLKLSGGERQRMAIARTLLINPTILLLDEATSALDYLTEDKVQRHFDVYTQNKIAFVVAHRLSTVRQAAKIIVLKEGSIVEFGNHDTLIAAKGEYHRLWAMQSANRNAEL